MIERALRTSSLGSDSQPVARLYSGGLRSRHHCPDEHAQAQHFEPVRPPASGPHSCAGGPHPEEHGEAQDGGAIDSRRPTGVDRDDFQV
jgi:hypothetical protein